MCNFRKARDTWGRTRSTHNSRRRYSKARCNCRKDRSYRTNRMYHICNRSKLRNPYRYKSSWRTPRRIRYIPWCTFHSRHRYSKLPHSCRRRCSYCTSLNPLSNRSICRNSHRSLCNFRKARDTWGRTRSTHNSRRRYSKARCNCRKDRSYRTNRMSHICNRSKLRNPYRHKSSCRMPHRIRHIPWYIFRSRHRYSRLLRSYRRCGSRCTSLNPLSNRSICRNSHRSLCNFRKARDTWGRTRSTHNSRRRYSKARCNCRKDRSYRTNRMYHICNRSKLRNPYRYKSSWRTPRRIRYIPWCTFHSRHRYSRLQRSCRRHGSYCTNHRRPHSLSRFRTLRKGRYSYRKALRTLYRSSHTHSICRHYSKARCMHRNDRSFRTNRNRSLGNYSTDRSLCKEPSMNHSRRRWGIWSHNRRRCHTHSKYRRRNQCTYRSLRKVRCIRCRYRSPDNNPRRIRRIYSTVGIYCTHNRHTHCRYCTYPWCSQCICCSKDTYMQRSTHTCCR